MSFWYKISAVFVCVALFQIFVPNWYQVVVNADALSFGRLTTEAEKAKPEEEKSSVLFFGDVMLARDVERHVQQQGLSYPFSGFTIPERAYAVANFESAIPSEHVPTPNNTFRFSTPKHFLPAVREAGFTHLSLANNHSFDFGLAGYNHSVTALWDAQLVPFGHPTVLDEASVTYLETQERKIAVVGVHTLFTTPSAEQITSIMSEVVSQSDLQVLYIHWGEEYELTQNEAQRTLAKTFIDAGIDLVIGHHPHVVQGIERLGDALVFYSLGNYIFDQYFSPDVQHGLVLELLGNNAPAISLIPVSTLEKRAQPQPLTGSNKDNFLKELALRSSPELSEEILAGQITIAKSLASSE